jgi:hypothetical protein
MPRASLEDKSGVTDLKRGFLQSGEESATSVKIRNAGGGARPGNVPRLADGSVDTRQLAARVNLHNLT